MPSPSLILQIIMISKLFRAHYKYSQHPLPPSTFSLLLRQCLPCPLPQLLHPLHLYHRNLLPFDPDYYHQASYHLLNYQKKMSVNDIVTVLGLGLRYGVRNEMLWRHMEAELHGRLHGVMWPVLDGEIKEEREKIARLMEGFEKGNGDLFGMLTREFVEQQQGQQTQDRVDSTGLQSQPASTPTPTSTPTFKAPSLPPKHPQILHNLYSFTDILIWYGCSNNQFLTLLLQSQLHPQLAPRTPAALLRVSQLLVYTLQTLMKQYQTHKALYTARSIKSIYKYQACYLAPIVKNMNTMLSAFSEEELSYLTEVMGSFPIKRRAQRVAVVYAIKNEWQRRGRQLGAEQEAKLVEMLGADAKLIAGYCKDYGVQLEGGSQGDGQVGERLQGKQQDKEEQENEGEEKEDHRSEQTAAGKH